MAEFTFEEATGLSSPSQPTAPKEFSFEDAIGSAPAPVAAAAPAPTVKAFSFEDVAPSNPGIFDYLGEIGKRFTRDAIEGQVAGPLRGVATIPPEFFGEPDQIMQAQIERMQRGDNPDIFKSPDLGKLAENPLYKAGEAVTAASNRMLPDRGILNPVVSDIAGGFGSVAGNIGTAMIPVAGMPLTVLTNLTGQGSGDAAKSAIQAGATEDQIRRAAVLGNFAGATEFADALLPSFLGSIGKGYGFLKKVGLRAAQGAWVEGGQEGLQQFIQNAIAKGIYDPKQDLIDFGGNNSVAYSALIGAIVGGGTGAIIPHHMTEQTTTTPATPETIAASVAPPQEAPLRPVTSEQPTTEVPPAEPATTPPPAVQPTSAPPQQPVMPTGGEQLSMNLEPPTPPTVAETEAKTMNPTVVQHLQTEAAKLKVPTETPPFTALINPQTGLLKEEIRSEPGADLGRLAKLFSSKLYGDPTDTTPVSVKELFQNSFDSLKGVLERGESDNGNIDFTLDPKKRTVAIQDDGAGMHPKILATKFLEIAGTHKETKRASGGLGIAKMLFLYSNKALRVTTMRDGKVATMNTTGDEIFSSLTNKSQAPIVSVRSPTSADLRMFPKGHGTRIEVVIPEQFTDPSTGETKPIPFDASTFAYPVLESSPLFDNINVRFNGRQLPIGTQFPLEDYTHLTNLKFDWGNARVYVSKNTTGVYYTPNAHVLSNGLWQFSFEIKEDPAKPYGKNLPYNFYVDLNSKVDPTEPGYPFDLNRQQFAMTAKKDFANFFKWVSLIYKQAEYETMAKNFGSMQYLTFDTETKRVKASATEKVEPKVPQRETPLSLTQLGGDVSIKDGELRINGRVIPELTPEELKNFKVDTSNLRIEQTEIRADQIMLHDNTDVVVSKVETRPITEYGREKFGQRFDEFIYAVGAAFHELRNAVVKFGGTVDIMKQVPFGAREPDYSRLKSSAVGISFDREYRGVSIVIPFEGLFVNPVVPQSTNPLEAAVDVAITMVHEIAHHNERNHGPPWRDEFQRLLRVLDTTEGFNFYDFKQKMVNIFTAYNDVFQHMNGVYTSGDFSLQSRGKRFEDVGSDETRNGLSLSDTSRLGNQPERGAKLSDWVAAGQTIAPSEQGRAGAALQVGQSRSTRPSDNGRALNYAALRAIDSGIVAAPQQPDIMPIREGVASALGTSTTALPPPVKEALAHADRFNWLYKFFAGITELLDANPNFGPLRKYVERVRAMHSDESRIQDAAVRIVKDWRSLGDRAKNLEALILDVQAMPYLTADQRKNRRWRHPTVAEFDALVRKHRVDDESLQVYNRLRSMDETFLKLVEQNAVDIARRRITDPVKLAEKIDEIRATGVQARAQPFFPFTRFGRYYVSVTDAAGNVVHFETVEPKKALGITVKSAERYQKQAEGRLKRQFPPDHKVTAGVLPETAGPLIGMPTLLMQQMLGEDIGLTPEQISAIRLLQNMRNSPMKLGDRSEYRASPVPGYSLDLQRSFARYYFHGARYYAKVRHAWGLKGNIAEAQLSPGNKAGLIASYMSDHLQNTVLDARGDFGFFKGAIFLWAMGYVPAAATQNLTQTPMITLPFLAGKFGDFRASREIVNAMRKVSTFYRSGRIEALEASAFEYRALSYGIKTGRISETQAPELAGIASGNLLITGQGGTPFQRKVVAFQEKAAFMFEMAEQFNRRVAYRAALNLALKNPTAKFVEESVKKYADEFNTLKADNNEAEARAIVTAIAATDSTQYVYARYARPRIMRGPLPSTLFVFKRYMQSTLYMLGHNKADVLPRYLVVAMLMGGLGGVPGYDDMAGIFKAFGKWFFGKDVDIDRMVREYVMQWFNGKVEPDLVLHGLARRGFGIPGLVDTLGSFFTNRDGRGLTSKPAANVPLPLIDRSRALSMGNILPVDFGKIAQADQDMNRTMADQTQKASGAVFSVGFNMFKALFDSHMQATDAKRWEPAMPRALSAVSKSFRAFYEGRERAKGGPNSAATVVNYDTRDTEQMMEALALAAGYQPLRVQAKWDSVMAQVEVTAFLDFKRKGLTEQYFEALKGKNPNEVSEVRDAIVKFNRELPDWARGKAISADTLRKSITSRERALQARESGTPAQKSNIPIARHIQELFPESVIDVRKVR